MFVPDRAIWAISAYDKPGRRPRAGPQVPAVARGIAAVEAQTNAAPGLAGARPDRGRSSCDDLARAMPADMPGVPGRGFAPVAGASPLGWRTTSGGMGAE